MIKRMITGFFICILFSLVIFASFEIHFIFFDFFVLLLMLLGVLEIRRAIMKPLGRPVLPLVLYAAALGYCLYYTLYNVGKFEIYYAIAVYLFTIVSVMIACIVFHAIMEKRGKVSTHDDAENPSIECLASKVEEGKEEEGVITGGDKCDADTGVHQAVATSNAKTLPARNVIDTSATATMFCLIYPCVFLCFMLSLNYLSQPYRAFSILLLFLVTPLNDVFAYMVGSTLKGKKLCPKISPKKTISGAIGGLFGGIAGGAIMILLTTNSAFDFVIDGMLSQNTVTNAVHCIILGFGGSLFTQLGDILASFIKRKCKIKDFGTLLPGHGGVIDRIDGMMLNACFIFIYMACITL